MRVALFVVAAVCTAAAAQAQVGTGWAQYSPTRKIHLDDESGLRTFSWTSYVSVCSPICADYRYDSATGIETFRILNTKSNRSEIRWENNYTSGRRQFEGHVRVSSPTHNESVHQVFGRDTAADGSAPAMMIKAYNSNGGELRREGGGKVLISGIYGAWVRVNTVHFVSSSGGTIDTYINGSLKDAGFYGGGLANHYHKHGVYGTLGASSAKVEWRGTKVFREGTSSTPTPTPVSRVTPTPAPTPTPAGSTEITPAASAVTASTNDGNVPGNAVDGSLATRWSANGDNQWIQFDLGTTRAVSHVKIATYQGNTRTTRFDLQISTGGGVWTNVLTAAQTSGTTTGEETFDFADVSARWVRYMGHGNSANMWNSVTEVSIFAP